MQICQKVKIEPKTIIKCLKGLGPHFVNMEAAKQLISSGEALQRERKGKRGGTLGDAKWVQQAAQAAFPSLLDDCNSSYIYIYQALQVPCSNC